uniref:dUTP diphosphatase n=1 Tax=Pithovirus LCPAC401 TaxID=2506595 RepID=A0A481Z9H5_9VIRU|nr:MAG: dUTP diphosphatase [Pithovirus LCPAC401]
MSFKVVVSQNASVPKRATSDSAGYDLFANEDMKIESGDIAKIVLGIKISLPPGTCGQILPRSGFTTKERGLVITGTIDSDYTGELGVMMINFGVKPLIIEKGMRIAQLVIISIVTPDVTLVEKLEETSRKGGFGSTGMF